jgi:S-DNA-T family DNA segregation ATPase FtsK/SpoIIIE
MPWEFRKVTPGDNVAVEASTDPFAAPKWAPPVWHMPPVLVLFVGLLRAVIRVVVFAVRHPILTVTVAGAVWVWARYGWRPLAVGAGLVAFALLVWVVADRASFIRHIGRPARGWWRLVWIYRRHWQPVMITTGLGKVHKGREYLPTLRKVRCGASTDLVLVRMLAGQSPAAWARVADNLAHGFGASLCRVRSGPRPGRVWLEFVRKDALAHPIPALPIPADARAVDLRALPIGRREDGQLWRLRLLGTHVLIAGATGSGKGSILWSIIRALLPAMAAGWVRVWAIDPKRMELSYGRAIFQRYGRYSDDPAGGMVTLLEDAATEMQARAGLFAGATRTFTPTRAHPFVVVVVDELAFLTAYCPDRDLRKRAEAALATLTSQGRSVGVCVVGAQQDARKEVNNLRNLFPDRIALRLDESEQVDMVLGDGARDRGALADLISPNPAIGAGVGYIRLETEPDPVRVRAAYVTDHDITAMARACQPPTGTSGTETQESGAA